MQGQVAYFKAVAAKHRSATSSTLQRMSERLTELNPNPIPERRRSKSVVGKRPSKLSFDQPSSTICVKFEPDPFLLQNIREETKSVIPVSDIIKPYMHRGSIARHVSMRHSLIQAKADHVDTSKVLGDAPEILSVLADKKNEIKKKEEEIEHLQTHIHLLSSLPYLNPTPAACEFPHLCGAPPLLPTGRLDERPPESSHSTSRAESHPQSLQWSDSSSDWATSSVQYF